MRRVAIVAPPGVAALHGLDGAFGWGDARTFAPEDDVAAWEPTTVLALGVTAPEGPWRTIDWGRRRAPLPASDALVALRDRPGTGVVLAGPDRDPATEKLRARGVPATGVDALTFAALEQAAVVVLLGGQGEPLPDAAPAVLAAGRLLVAPRSEPGFGLLAFSDHLSYANEDELVFSTDSAYSFPDAFEPLAAMGVIAAAAHLASAVYGRLAVDAELGA